MAYGFNDDKSKCEIPVKSKILATIQYDSSETVSAFWTRFKNAVNDATAIYGDNVKIRYISGTSIFSVMKMVAYTKGSSNLYSNPKFIGVNESLTIENSLYKNTKTIRIIDFSKAETSTEILSEITYVIKTGVGETQLTNNEVEAGLRGQSTAILNQLKFEIIAT